MRIAGLSPVGEYLRYARSMRRKRCMAKRAMRVWANCPAQLLRETRAAHPNTRAPNSHADTADCYT